MKNITSRADVFPFPRSFLDHLNRRAKIKLRCRCFVNFFAVMRCSLFFFCGVAVLTVPQCPPQQGRLWHRWPQFFPTFLVVSRLDCKPPKTYFPFGLWSERKIGLRISKLQAGENRVIRYSRLVQASPVNIAKAVEADDCFFFFTCKFLAGYLRGWNFFDSLSCVCLFR